MYVSGVRLDEFRAVASTEAGLVHPDLPSARTLELPNVTVLLGSNGGGKSTLLKGIVAATLGPTPELDRLTVAWPRRNSAAECSARVTLDLHELDVDGPDAGAEPSPRPAGAAPTGTAPTGRTVQRGVRIPRDGGDPEWLVPPEGPGIDDTGPAYFLAAYGPHRRVVEDGPAIGLWWSATPRLRRVATLVRDDAGLIPLEQWLDPGDAARFEEVVRLVDHLLPADVSFAGELEDGDFLYRQRGVAVPRVALSDGVQSFLAWISDLLRQVVDVAPEAPIASVPGTVLVDEIDQRVHPEWQERMLSRLSANLPRMQFVCSAHSPLLASALRPENMLLMEPDPDAPGVGAVRARRLREDVFGSTADQVLRSSYFELESSRSDVFRAELRLLAGEARLGNSDAALEFMRRLAEAGDAIEDGAAVERSFAGRRPIARRRRVRRDGGGR
jgi:hypothetical protein